MIDVSLLFFGIGFIITLGFLANLFFKKTKIPDVIWLLFLGILLGPLTHTLKSSFLLEFAPYVAALATMIILFEGGMKTDLYTLIKQAPISFFIAVGNVALSMVFISFFMKTFLGWAWVYGALLGTIVSGTGSAIILSITSGLRLNSKTFIILNLESTLTTVFCFVIGMALLSIIVSGTGSLKETLNQIFGMFSIGAVVGFMAGVFWLYLMRRIRGKFKYMLTLAFLFITFAFVEGINGSGAIAALVFGIVLGNGKDISRILKSKDHLVINPKIKEFHEEISFLVRSFFFVYLGSLVSISNVSFIVVGVLLSLLLLGIRIVVSFTSFFLTPLEEYEKKIVAILFPRGLAAAVLSQFPMAYGIEYSNWFLNIVFVIILTSILISSIGIFLIKRK
ncbi:MAG: cation:proton antiporter [Candidatus Aenigmarchaeota archaeon]|nr:cation:proton antiporter [Candidatus Aenigmarchaeota archaeon]